MRLALGIVIVTLTLGFGYGPILAQTHPGDVPLDSIRMIDALTGRAVTDESGAETLLHTSDGGAHWLDVSPFKPSGGQTVEYQVTALSSLVAWVASSDTDTGSPTGTTHIFHTVDGGRTWRNVTIPAWSGTSMHFINPRDGWLMSGAGALGRMEVDIYRSTDGGGTWAKVGSTRVNDESSGLPFAGDKAGMIFLNTTRGWVTGAITWAPVAYAISRQ